ncbi:hypothetical protein SLS61_005603 [Didymella pomorum]
MVCTAQPDWQGLGDRRRAHAPQPPVGIQPTQQSKELIMMDAQDLRHIDAQLRQSNEFARLGTSADLRQMLNPPFQSPPQQAPSDADHLSYEPTSQATHGIDATRPDDISVRLLELVRSQGISLNGTLALSAHRHTSQSHRPPLTPQAEYAAQFPEVLQLVVSSNGSGPVVHREQFLSCFSAQRITYMQGQLASSIPYHEVFKGQHPLRWAVLAHALHLWDARDAEVLQAACLNNGIGVSWGSLDQMGSQAQLVLGQPPLLAPHGTQRIQDPPSQGMPPPALNHLLFQLEFQAYQYCPAEGIRELVSSRGDDRIEPADESVQISQSMESLEEWTPLEPDTPDEPLSQDGPLDQEAFAPIPLSFHPSAHSASLQQTEAATSLPLPAQEASEAQQNGEAAADPEPSSNAATATTQFAQTQEPQQSPAAQDSRATKAPRKKALKRIVFDPLAILRPRSDDDAKIRLATEEDRVAFTADISWFKPADPQAFHKIPETDEELELFVVYMLECMMDTSKAEDKKGPRSSFDNRWSKKAFKEKGWPVSLEAMEVICWIIVKMAWRYHRDGPAFLNLFDRLHQDKAEKNQDLTFFQRISVISTVLLISKSRVDTCCKHENLGSLVAFPLSILADCKANRPFNELRTATLAAGTEALKKKAEKEAKEAAAKQAVKEVTGDDQGASADADEATLQGGSEQEVEEEGNEVEGEEEVEKDEEYDADADADDDENQDDDGRDDEDGNNRAENSTGSSQPGANPSEETDRDNGGQSGRAGDADTSTGASKSSHANSHYHQAHAEQAPTAAPTTEVDTRGPSKLSAKGLTTPSAGALLQAQPSTARATTASPQHAPAATSGHSRKRSVKDLLEPTRSSKPSTSNNKVRRGPIGVFPAARTSTRNGTQVSFHSMGHLASIDATLGSGPSPRVFAASKSKASRKRSATSEHLGSKLPSAPKRSCNASHANSNDRTTYGTRRTITGPTVPPPIRTMAPLTSSPAPPTPLLTPPTKRRANETGLSDINTREKSARSVDRQIIAPKRRPVPPSSEG